jgi:hypothetical protein
VKNLKKPTARPGTGYVTDHKMDLAASLPIAAAFRELLELKGDLYQWKVQPAAGAFLGPLAPRQRRPRDLLLTCNPRDLAAAPLPIVWYIRHLWSQGRHAGDIHADKDGPWPQNSMNFSKEPVLQQRCRNVMKHG